MTKALQPSTVPDARRSLLERDGRRVIQAAVALVVLSLSACAAQRGPSEPVSPQRLAIGYAVPGGQEELVRELTTEGLLGLTIDGEHRPLLAQSWTISDDGLTVSIQVREDVAFHRGAALSAKVVAGFLDSARVDSRQLQNHPALADIASIETLGPMRLQLHLSRPSALIEDALTLGIELDENGLPSGTGPFALSTATEGQITFVANRDYHGGPPAVDVVTLTNYPNHRSAWVAMMRNEVDFLYEVPTSAWDFLEAESTVELYSVARPYAVTVAFNMRQPPFGDTTVRQALNHAVDRRAVIERALGEGSRPASGVWAQHWAYGGVERVYRYDPLWADEMLTRAGFPPPVAGQQPTDPDRVPARLRFTCLVPSDTPTYEETALMVQRQMQAVGVDMNLESVDPRQLMTRVASGDWDAALVPQNTGRTPSRLYNMWHSSEPRAVFGYTAADDVLESLRHAGTREELAIASTAFQQMLYDDPPAIFIADDRHARAVSRRFEVPPLIPGQDVMETLWRWRRADQLP